MSVKRLHWAIFTASIVSSVENPGAHLWRSFGHRLQQRGNPATFYEERGNRALRALLRRERSAGLIDFRERFPELQYRTIDQRRGFALGEWLMRTLSTVDIVLADRDAAPELIQALSNFSRPFLQTFLVDPGCSSTSTEPASLTNFTGVLVGNESLVACYSDAIDAARIQPFGPLPADLSDEQPTAEQITALDDAAERAIATIIRVSEKIRRARGTQMVANGRTDPSGPWVAHEPD